MKKTLPLLFAAALLLGPACSSKKEDPAPAPVLQAELTAPDGKIVAYVNGVATTFALSTAGSDSDSNETRYVLSTTISATEAFAVRFVVPAGQPVPNARAQAVSLIINTGGRGIPLTTTFGAGAGVLTVKPAPGPVGQRAFTGTFSGTVGNYKIEGGKFLNVLTQ